MNLSFKISFQTSLCNINKSERRIFGCYGGHYCTWRFGTEHGVLWRKIITAKYGLQSIGGRPPDVTTTYGCSLWRGILASKSLFFSGVRYCVGQGNNIRFWHDVWCGEEPFSLRFQNIFRFTVLKEGTAMDHMSMDVNGVNWNLQVCRRSIRESEAISLNALTDAISTTHIGDGDDSWEWKWTKEKTFTVKSFYRQLLKASRNGAEITSPFPH
ncbi:hypothetical protein IFM89_026339 [Coptis chinensis]|uniref:RNA-directed DNA polymerase, eukaryota, Reverse transcriptase zinc-binding domain protein n=1 Tax=Coptis chinensis TaxID=261450 RepID=A0A835HPL7_9MAGN|nr:hypothetical protein IFM89_026339 [Coptis chinensis]